MKIRRLGGIAVIIGSVQAFTSVSLLPVASRRLTPSKARPISISRLHMFDSTSLFELQTWAGGVAATELTHITPLSLGIMYGTGLLMSFSPCSLSLLPLTMAYIGSDASDNDDESSNSFLPSAAFAGGLATVLSTFGLSATLAGKVFGSVGDFGGSVLPAFASILAITAGLNLLELINLKLPSIESDINDSSSNTRISRLGRAYLLGATSAFVASPCCTPVLASILGFVATTQDPVLGLFLLFFYSLGYTTPLMLAGTVSGALGGLMRANGLTWVTPVSAAVLISYGTYTGLGLIFGPA